MKIFETLKHWTPAVRFALPASLVATIWGLLAFATPASAEVGEAIEIDGASAAVTAAAEMPAAVVEGEGVQTAPAAPAPEPVEVEAREVPSAAETADVPPASDRVGPQGSPPAPQSIDSASPSPDVAVTGQEASELVRGVGKGSVEPNGASTGRRPAAWISSPGSSLKRSDDSLQLVVEPLLQVAALAQDSLGSLGPAVVEALLPPVGPLLEPAPAAGPSAIAPLRLPPPRPGSLFHLPVIGGSALQRLPEPGGVEAIAAGSRAPGSSTEPAMQPAIAGDANAILAATAIDRSHSQNPAPLDVPLPAPGSPGAIAPGSGCPIFVPLAALLALLALAAPAILRRLGRVSAFRLPTPFVCALERPG